MSIDIETTIIFGKRGAGKTALATMFGIDRMTRFAYDDVKRVKTEIKRLNRGGFGLCFNERHVLFADYAIRSNVEGYSRRQSFEVDGYALGMPDKGHRTMFLPPYSTVILDEAQRYYDSHIPVASFPERVSAFYEFARHYGISAILALQRPMLIQKNIRDLAERFIKVESVKAVEDRYGFVRRCEWDCLEFYDNLDLERYLDSKGREENGKRVKYRCDYDIFRCYDSQSRFAMFLDGFENREDFDIIESSSVGRTVASIRLYNKFHSWVRPSTYLQSRR
ncbi:MAG: zonular occludens toxin domain-containing protein [Clostridiales bacterium]|jgi:hypothetical protein|nr:zonular occludens toxin domain-containing protein [Clostridiales bacterium]